jgi:DNA-binding LytR/AlgR family response regulator
MIPLQEQLNEEQFIRINKSYILNKAKVTKTENSEVYIQQYGFTRSRMLKKDIKHKLGLLPLVR